MHGFEAIYLINIFRHYYRLGNFCIEFSKIVGQETLPTFKDLETRLSDMGPVVPNDRLQKIDDGNCSFLPKLEDGRVQSKEGLLETKDESQNGVTKLGEHLSRNGIKE